jgi:uncharacterized protein YbjT (DUF2867 family)
MTCAVIGATGRIGSAVVSGLLAERQPVIALVRDSGKAHELFGTEGNLQVREIPFDRPAEVRMALDGAATVFLAMGSVGAEGNIQRTAIQAVAMSSARQLVRLSVLNASADSLGINQRAHWSIDERARHAGGNRPDRARAAQRRSLPARESRAVPLDRPVERAG